jgi:hypothetical protein
MGVKTIEKITTYELLQKEVYVKQKKSKLIDNLGCVDMIIPTFIDILERELKKYEQYKNKYYINLINSLIHDCKEILDLPEVKKLIKHKEEYFKNIIS